MLINIGVDYLTIILAIQKHKKDEKTNLAEAIL